MPWEMLSAKVHNMRAEQNQQKVSPHLTNSASIHHVERPKEQKRGGPNPPVVQS